MPVTPLRPGNGGDGSARGFLGAFLGGVSDGLLLVSPGGGSCFCVLEN
jgi:hypothetical protein